MGRPRTANSADTCDRLVAKDSILFENAIAQVPLTLPSHAAIFTGLLPFENGVRDNLGYRLPEGTATLASLLKAAGYATGGAVSSAVLDRSTGVAAGFDFWDDRIEASRAGEALGDVQRPGAETEKRLETWIAANTGKASLRSSTSTSRTLRIRLPSPTHPATRPSLRRRDRRRRRGRGRLPRS